MSNFKSREEYERWKAERLSGPEQPVSSRPGRPAAAQPPAKAAAEGTEKTVRRTFGTDVVGTAWKPVVIACSITAVLSAALFAGKMGLLDSVAETLRLVKKIEWREVAVAEAGFSIQMPRDPVRTSKEVPLEGGAGTMQMISYDAPTRGKNGYGVLHYDLPGQITGNTDVNTLYRTVTDSVIAEFKGRLVSEKAMALGPWPGKEVHAENDREAFRALMFLVNGRLYQMIAYQPKDEILGTEIDWFLSSFKLTTADGQVLSPREPLVVTWVEFAPTGARFSVELPGAPVLTEENVPTSAGSMMVYRFELERKELNEHFSVQYADYPRKLLKKMKTSKAVLTSAASADVENFRGTLVSQKTLTTFPCPGQELHAESGEAAMRLRVFLAGDRLYKVKAVGPRNLLFTAEGDRFMNSFRLVADETKGVSHAKAGP